uniref:Cilia- and flagella-associated protein 58 central coiled coil domain-containing protein n=1 Tax=Timema genevievae TaxID=629358 RepID=A0A7R9JNG4_TIMGE|nr:unnamed protein product [Timema genevievae]
MTFGDNEDQDEGFGKRIASQLRCCNCMQSSLTPILNNHLKYPRRGPTDNIFSAKQTTKLTRQPLAAVACGSEEEVWHVQKNINTLVSNVNLIALERQDQLNRCQRLKQQLEQLWGDGRILDIHLNMSSKALDVELRQLESLKNDCDHFRTERNKDYHHMLVVQQQVVEHREKYKLIITEVENLKALSNQRERQLNKLYIKLESENKDRKTLCNQLAAWTRQLKDTKLEKVAASEKVRQVHLGIAKCRHEGSTLQKEYNILVSERNFQGLKLRDMLEEAVIFQEQIKTFHDMIKRADSELEQRMEASTVELLKKFIKRNKNSAKKLVKVSEELEQVTTKEFELETKFEIGNRHKMVCESRAWKEDPNKLRKKLQQLERRVIAKEAKVVELKLVQDRIEGLILKLQQELTLMQVVCQGTIQTSSQQKKTEGLCRQAKALVSELALAHTYVKQLKLESHLKHEKLDLVKKRLEQVVADHSES